MTFKSLKCPSCGGELAIPDSLAVAFCMHCGQKILLDETDLARERKKVVRYEELCATALEVGNYDDLARYADQLLELDARNATAWVYKAHAVFSSCTVDQDRSEEAKQYLRKAAEVAPGDARIHEVLMHWGTALARVYRETALEWWGHNRHQAAQLCLDSLRFARDDKMAAGILEVFARLVGPPGYWSKPPTTLKGLVQLAWSGKRDIVVPEPDDSCWEQFRGVNVLVYLNALKALQNREDSGSMRIRELEAALHNLQNRLERLRGLRGQWFVRGEIDATELQMKTAVAELEEVRKRVSDREHQQQLALDECRKQWGSFYSL